MRRVYRWLLIACSTLSLLVIVVSTCSFAIAFGWSGERRWREDAVNMNGVPGTSFGVTRGCFVYYHSSYRAQAMLGGFRSVVGQGWQARLGSGDPRIRLTGAGTTSYALGGVGLAVHQSGALTFGSGISEAVQLCLPLPLLLLLTAWPTYFRFRDRRRAAVVAAGRCGGCGYDLRETPERCPECGRSPEEVVHG
jgi:hypothetical protein